MKKFNVVKVIAGTTITVKPGVYFQERVKNLNRLTKPKRERYFKILEM